jgi:hypothetical protein
MPTLGTHVGAKLHRAIARVRCHDFDDHHPCAHGAKGARHSRQPLFRRHAMPFRRKRVAPLIRAHGSYLSTRARSTFRADVGHTRPLRAQNAAGSPTRSIELAERNLGGRQALYFRNPSVCCSLSRTSKQNPRGVVGLRLLNSIEDDRLWDDSISWLCHAPNPVLTLRRPHEIPSSSSEKFVDISSIVMASGAAEYGEEPEIGRPSNHLPRSQREAPNLTALSDVQKRSDSTPPKAMRNSNVTTRAVCTLSLMLTL